MIQELQTERLDINNKYDIDFSCKQLDDIILKIIVYDKSIPANLGDYTCRLKAFKRDQVPLIQNTNITIKDNVVTIKADKQLTTTNGIVKAELQFINKTTLEKKSTFYINIEVVASVLDVEGTVSTPTCTILEEIDHKLDQIENIGEVLDEAKEVRDTLTNKTIPTATNINSKLETSTKNASTKITEVESIISSASIKIEEVETCINNADFSKKELDLSKTNADMSKENLNAANTLAEKNIEELNKLGDVTDLAKNVQTNTTDIANLKENVENNNSKLKENTQNIKNVDGRNSVATDANNLGIVGQKTIDRTDGNTLNTPYKQGISKSYASGLIETYLSSSKFGIQIYYSSGYELFKRSLINGTWSEWKQIITIDDTGWIDISSTINSKATGTAKIRRICNEVFFEIRYKGIINENEIVATMPAEYAPKGQSEYVFCRFPTGIITLDIQPNGRVMMDYVNVNTQKPDFWCSARTSYLID
ncbi:viral A-type inclusion protein [Clostridium botulinum]|nr:viral A-type inclusion protein [Clostridium botulinum]NFI19706.1 viral A-type inclusion protein [Clostridium botulinum]NFL94365.1 viral A-type inclusion protein [Clostridium botulinum]NFN50506.1 viral A-type inclusion protein [Clostridium botulinum]NFO26349.1 viral A-type inclusion protein [Clostridium botulinum]